MCTPLDARPCRADRDQKRCDCHMKETRSPDFIRRHHQYRDHCDCATCYKKGEHGDLLTRVDNPRNCPHAEQHHRRENEKAFVGRTEHTDRVREDLKWRIRRPLSQQNVRAAALRTPEKTRSHSSDCPDAACNEQHHQQLFPSRAPLAPELYVDQPGDGRPQNNSGGLGADCQATYRGEQHEPRQSSDLSICDGHVAGQQNKKRLLGFQTDIGVGPEHGAERSDQRQQQTYAWRAKPQQPEVRKREHRSGQQQWLQRKDKIRRDETLSELDEWKIQKQSDWSVARPRYRRYRPSFDPRIEAGQESQSGLHVLIDVAPAACRCGSQREIADEEAEQEYPCGFADRSSTHTRDFAIICHPQRE